MAPPFLTICAVVIVTLLPVRAEEETLESLPGAETFVYRDGKPAAMRLFVVKPKGWRANEQRSAFVWFFGGGWLRGNPQQSIGWARWAAELGMVGIAPDYRTRDRFKTSPRDSVADARASVRWLQDHAPELGIDPARIVVGGYSAGGHVAMWTGISVVPPGSDEAETPGQKPIGLILVSAVTDTSMLGSYRPTPFGGEAEALSPIHQLDPKMPPVLTFHGDGDELVPHSQAVALDKKLRGAGGVSEFVTVPGGSHGFLGQPKWRDEMKAAMEKFLRKIRALPAES
ncbi:MAG: alpha/beta hydrolase [Chthoniobacterales bacterium]